MIQEMAEDDDYSSIASNRVSQIMQATESNRVSMVSINQKLPLSVVEYVPHFAQ